MKILDLHTFERGRNEPSYYVRHADGSPKVVAPEQGSIDAQGDKCYDGSATDRAKVTRRPPFDLGWNRAKRDRESLSYLVLDDIPE